MVKMLYGLFAFKLFVIIILWARWLDQTNTHKFSRYLEELSNHKLDLEVVTFQEGFENLLRIVIMYSHMIPISIYVAVEILKLLQFRRIQRFLNEPDLSN